MSCAIHPERKSGRPLVYEIVSCEPPIAIDTSVCVKQLLLTAIQVERYDRFLQSIKPLLVPTDGIGFCLATAVLFVDADARPWLVSIALLLQLPFKFHILLSCRVECVRLLTQTFEWRFMFISVLIWLVGFACSFRDSRVWVLLSSAMDFFNGSLTETLFKSPRGLIIKSIMSMGFLLIIMAGLLFSLFGKPTGYPTLLVSRYHTVTMKDLLQNTTGTVFMLFCRLTYTLYRRRNRVQGARHTRFTGYYFRIRLRLRSSPSASTIVLLPNRQVTATDNQNGTVVSLRLSNRYDNLVIDSENTLVPSIAACRLSSAKRWVLHSVGAMGVFMTFAVLCPWNVLGVKPRECVAIAALFSTAVFCFWLGCHFQHQLVRHLAASFHFLFFSVQITVAVLCCFAIANYDRATCCAFCACWIWVHCALFVDTICPGTKRESLGLRRTHWALRTMWLYCLIQTLGVTEVLLQNQWNREDPEIWKYQWHGHAIRFQMVPFLFSHQVMILVWATRLAMRSFQRQSEDDLVVLRGIVEYDALSVNPRRRIAAALPHGDRPVK